jgi:uncharacterized protein (TIGR02996 family)
MPITWFDGPDAGQVLYAGAVLTVGSRDVRVMSDVWDSERYATVWDGTAVRDVRLDAWAYVARDGGWTQEWEDAADHEFVRPSDSDPLGGEGYWKKDQRHFQARAEVDATAEVRAAVAGWAAINELIQSTRDRLRRASVVGIHKEVEVWKGRKVPHGVYEATCNPRQGQYGDFVHLRDRDGRAFSFVSVDNVRVVRPGRYVGVIVACQACRRTFDTAEAAGMEAGAWADATCGECRLAEVLDGHRDLTMPAWSAHCYYSPFRDQPALRGKGVGELMVRDIFAQPDDKDLWLIFCDWLEEDGQEERGRGLRLAILGQPKTRQKPIRKKDLKVTPWEVFHRAPDSSFSVFECVVSGFPADEDGNDQVVVRGIPGRSPLFWLANSQETRPLLFGPQRRQPRGTLLRQCKAVVVPPVG